MRYYTWVEPKSADDPSPVHQTLSEEEMKLFSREVAIQLQSSQIDGFLLKAVSPSCGIKDVKIYNSPESKSPIGKGKGAFANGISEFFPLFPMQSPPVVSRSEFTI